MYILYGCCTCHVAAAAAPSSAKTSLMRLPCRGCYCRWCPTSPWFYIHTRTYMCVCVLNLPPAEINDCWSLSFFFFSAETDRKTCWNSQYMYYAVYTVYYAVVIYAVYCVLCCMYCALCSMYRVLCRIHCVLCSIYDVMGKHQKQLLDLRSKAKNWT